MKRIITIAAILFISCSKEEPKPIEPTPQRITKRVQIIANAKANGKLYLKDTLFRTTNSINITFVMYVKDTLKVTMCGDNPIFKIFQDNEQHLSLSGTSGCVGTYHVVTE